MFQGLRAPIQATDFEPDETSLSSLEGDAAYRYRRASCRRAAANALGGRSLAIGIPAWLISGLLKLMLRSGGEVRKLLGASASCRLGDRPGGAGACDTARSFATAVGLAGPARIHVVAVIIAVAGALPRPARVRQLNFDACIPRLLLGL